MFKNKISTSLILLCICFALFLQLPFSIIIEVLISTLVEIATMRGHIKQKKTRLDSICHVVRWLRIDAIAEEILFHDSKRHGITCATNVMEENVIWFAHVSHWEQRTFAIFRSPEKFINLIALNYTFPGKHGWETNANANDYMTLSGRSFSRYFKGN